MYGIPVTVGRETVTIALRTVPRIPSIEQVVTRDPEKREKFASISLLCYRLYNSYVLDQVYLLL